MNKNKSRKRIKKKKKEKMKHKKNQTMKICAAAKCYYYKTTSYLQPYLHYSILSYLPPPCGVGDVAFPRGGGPLGGGPLGPPGGAPGGGPVVVR